MIRLFVTDDLKAGVNGLLNHADGRMYDGKRAFEAATRRARPGSCGPAPSTCAR